MPYLWLTLQEYDQWVNPYMYLYLWLTLQEYDQWVNHTSDYIKHYRIMIFQLSAYKMFNNK